MVAGSNPAGPTMKPIQVNVHEDIDRKILRRKSRATFNSVVDIQSQFVNRIIAKLIYENLYHRFEKTFDNNPYGSSDWYYECRLCGCLESTYKPLNPEQTCWEWRNKSTSGRWMRPWPR